MRICFDLFSLSSSGASIVASGLAEKVQDVESTQVARRVQGKSVGFRGDRGLLERPTPLSIVGLASGLFLFGLHAGGSHNKPSANAGNGTLDFIHLGVLNDDGVFWVTRSKESLCFRVVKRLPKGGDKRIFGDELIVLKNKDSRANYPQPIRRPSK